MAFDLVLISVHVLVTAINQPHGCFFILKRVYSTVKYTIVYGAG